MQKKKSSICWFTPQLHAIAKLGQEFKPYLPRGWKEATYLQYHLLLLKTHVSRTLNLEAKFKRNSIEDIDVAGDKCCAKHPI